MTVPDSPERAFATETVQRLREAGYEALWAGGCVRDELLGKTPKDYDVATTATPEQVIELFGQRRTVAVGANFGVVMVLGPNRRCGQIEVATFRSDGEYLDGRRPSSVVYCSAEEDARRRDFTINGMFYDPVGDEVIDYVGGRADLAIGVIRAIGDPRQRFQEDKLRILRAVRFAATYEFELEEQTAAAVSQLAPQLSVVSAERIAQELRRMLAHPTRDTSVRWMRELGLISEIPGCAADDWNAASSLLPKCLKLLKLPRFEAALACLMVPSLDWAGVPPKGLSARCRKLKLSNEEGGAIAWLVASMPEAVKAAELPLHRLKRLLFDTRAELLIDLVQAAQHGAAAEFLAEYLHGHGPEHLNPAPLLTGKDLKQLGHQPGPDFKRVLTAVRNEQLDEKIDTPEAALALAARLLAQSTGG
ncbi:MAG: CCA tRNA nucleotidyltransferase [Planctomycetaceae bacterium]|nr:CCA tRNA nucleotidyltransferase [Planctomycetaceae bacterium]